MKKYQIVRRNGREAIFDSNGNQVSWWWDKIWFNDLNKLEYYIAVDGDREAIFHVSNPDTPISRWWNWIFTDGLVDVQSEYYVAQDYNGKYAIFHKDNPYVPVSRWWNWIFTYGLVLWESEFYTVEDDNGCKATFHKDNPDVPVIDWYDCGDEFEDFII